jgi:hypothetical protein
VDDKHRGADDASKGYDIKYFDRCGVDVSGIAMAALGQEAVDLRHHAAFVVATDEEDMGGVGADEGENQEQRLDTVVAPVDTRASFLASCPCGHIVATVVRVALCLDRLKAGLLSKLQRTSGAATRKRA